MSARHRRRGVTYTQFRRMLLFLLAIGLIVNEAVRMDGPRALILGTALLCAGFEVSQIGDLWRTRPTVGKEGP